MKSKHIKIIVNIVIFFTFVNLLLILVYVNDLWVSQAGGGNCTSVFSPCSMQQAIIKVQPGDTIHITGKISTPFVFDKSGTKNNPIIITGGTVDTLGSTEQNAILITGSWIIVDNVEIMHGYDFGIRVNGDYVTIKNSKIHDNVTNPTNRLSNGKCNSIQESGWGSGHRHYLGADFGQVINNEVYNNCGEGITALQATSLRIIGNNVYDNFSVGIYIDSSQDINVSNNTVTANNPDYYRNNAPMSGIALGQEHYDWIADLQIKNIFIENNLLIEVGGIWFYSEIPNGHLEYLTIRNNIFQNVTKPQIYVPNNPINIGITIEGNQTINESE